MGRRAPNPCPSCPATFVPGHLNWVTSGLCLPVTMIPLGDVDLGARD